MKKLIKYILAFSLLTGSAFATNGDDPISITPAKEIIKLDTIYQGKAYGLTWYYVTWNIVAGRWYLIEEYDDYYMKNRTYIVFNAVGYERFARVKGEYHYRVTDFTTGAQGELSVYITN